MRVWLDSAFVLEIADFEVEAFDLAVQLERLYQQDLKNLRRVGKGRERETYQQSSLLTQPNLFFLDNLRFVEVGHDVFAIAFFFGVWLTSAIHFEKFLNATVASCNDISALLDNSIFGLDFFEKMGDFGG